MLNVEIKLGVVITHYCLMLFVLKQVTSFLNNNPRD